MHFASVHLLFGVRQDIYAGYGGVCPNSGVFAKVASVTDCPPDILAINGERNFDGDVTRLVVGVLGNHHQVGFGETLGLVVSDTVAFG